LNNLILHKRTDISFNEALDETEQLLQTSFKYRMVSDVPVGVFLSGGYDSSSVSALLQANSMNKIKTFTKGFQEHENYYSKYIHNIDFLSIETKDKILEDVKNIFKGFTTKSNFSSLSEYRYLTERNQKFHAYLAYIQKGDLVLTDFDLLTYMTSVPIEHKEQKKLIDFILNKYFPKVSNEKFENISSRDFNGVNTGFTLGNKLDGMAKWYNFKFLNRANAVLRPLTKGQIQLFNKYQTEEQERLLYRDFHKDLKQATEKFVNLGLMSEEQKQEWDALPLKSSGVGERFGIIGLGELIE